MRDATGGVDGTQTRRRREILAETVQARCRACPGPGRALPGPAARSGCHCHDDPPALHGPYRAWTRKVAGKTLTRALSEEQFERYRPWAENSRRLHDLVAELEQLSVISMARAEGWPEPAPPPPDRRRARSAGGEKPS